MTPLYDDNFNSHDKLGYSICILEDRCAMYNINKLPVISVLGRIKEITFFVNYIKYHSSAKNFQTIKTTLEVSQVNTTMQLKYFISGYS